MEPSRVERRNVAYSLKTRIVESQQTAVTRQRSVKLQKDGFFSAVRADSCARNNGIRHAIAKQQKNGVFYVVRAEICKQENLGMLAGSAAI
jgi:hypothetical protein